MATEAKVIGGALRHWAEQEEAKERAHRQEIDGLKRDVAALVDLLLEECAKGFRCSVTNPQWFEKREDAERAVMERARQTS